MAELKPCPFCGESGYMVHLQKLFHEKEDYPRWKVVCERCGARTDSVVEKEFAVNMWNWRTENG